MWTQKDKIAGLHPFDVGPAFYKYFVFTWIMAVYVFGNLSSYILTNGKEIYVVISVATRELQRYTW